MFAQNGLILAIPGPGEDWPEAVDVSLAVTLSTCGLVFPGMLNLHNHIDALDALAGIGATTLDKILAFALNGSATLAV